MKKLSNVAASIVPPFEPCAQCDNGWVPLMKPRYLGEQIGVVRCGCFLAHQQRIADALKTTDTRRKRQ